MSESREDARPGPLTVTVATGDVSTTVTGGMVKVVEIVLAKVTQVLPLSSKAL